MAAPVSGAAVGSRRRVAILTGGGDRHYSFGLAQSLSRLGAQIDFVGSDELESAEIRALPGLRFLNLKGDQNPNAPFVAKVRRILAYYAKLLAYAATSKATVFHILWNSRAEVFDRTILTLFYKALGKRVVLTAHNVNRGKRDGNDSVVNRATLRIQYHLVDHIFVHTPLMSRELESDFGVSPEKVTVIPFGINNMVPETGLTRDGARAKLGISANERVILFFGNIAPYKGLDYLIEALILLNERNLRCQLLIAGRLKAREDYLASIRRRISDSGLAGQVTERIEHIPDEETEIYFKSADALCLPYTHIFQSGVLFLGYAFGIPAIAADVGDFRSDIQEGVTGHLCAPRNPLSLANTLAKFFAGPIYRNLHEHSAAIRDTARKAHSWETVGAMTSQAYRNLQELHNERIKNQ
ncbi:MAG TPA: glycosyltransferase family 4 protein [Opitutaceae bacterium]